MDTKVEFKKPRQYYQNKQYKMCVIDMKHKVHVSKRDETNAGYIKHYSYLLVPTRGSSGHLMSRFLLLLALLLLVEDFSFLDEDLRTRPLFSLDEDFLTTPPPVMAGGAVRLEPATIAAGAEFEAFLALFASRLSSFTSKGRK